MLRIVPHTVPRVGRSYEHFPDGFELHLLRSAAEVLVGRATDTTVISSRRGEALQVNNLTFTIRTFDFYVKGVSLDYVGRIKT